MDGLFCIVASCLGIFFLIYRLFFLLFVLLFIQGLPSLFPSALSAAMMKSILIACLFRRHMEKKEQKERGFPAVGGHVDGMEMGRRQEVGVVEEGGLDEKYSGFDGGEMAQDGFERDVKVLERSVRGMEL